MVTGGIAAIETPKLARHLRRFGAEVEVFVTPTALDFIGEKALEWGLRQKIIKDFGGMAEHICRHHIFIVAPATLNTINKICAGVGDNVASTFIQSAMGIPETEMFVLPTMHESLSNNPILKSNLKKLIEYGFDIVPPRKSEGKDKIPNISTIVDYVIDKMLGSQDEVKGKLDGVKVLITSGGTICKIDDIRHIGNFSQGTTGAKIAEEFLRAGAQVYFLANKNSKMPFDMVINKEGDFRQEWSRIRKLHKEFEKYKDNLVVTPYKFFEEYYCGVEMYVSKCFMDVVIMAAAVSDYGVKAQAGKIKSIDDRMTLELFRNEKVISKVKKWNPNVCLVGFKLEVDVATNALKEIAQENIVKNQIDLVVANVVAGGDFKNRQMFILNNQGESEAINVDDLPSVLVDKIVERSINND